MRVTAPVLEHHREPLGIGESRPRLSWRTETDTPDWTQRAYRLEITGPDGALLVDTGRVESADSVLVEWPGEALGSRSRVGVRVRVWGEGPEPSAWSPLTRAETGLLSRSDWTARPVTPDRERADAPLPVALLHRTFALDRAVASARLYITAYGVYEAEINGTRVGDHVLAPGWTSYDHRLRYQTFDVTGLLRAGDNAIGAFLGEGWYTGRLGFDGGRRNLYGERRALLAQLEVTHPDGTVTTIATDGAWRATTGPVLRSELYDGEAYDARSARPGWSEPGHDLSDWSTVTELAPPEAELVAPTGPPVRRTQTLAPADVITTPSGKTVVDFGQNLVGRLRIRLSGPAGHTVTLRHAEVLEHGELGVRPLRQAAATDTYTLAGAGVETYEPGFTFHGFRYAEIENWPGELDPAAVEAVVLHTDMTRTGWFESSHELVNRLHENVVWGMRGNFLDIPTDCPQRDERLGWTGDIQVFAPTASFLYDCSGMLGGWLRDLAAEQFARPDRVPPLVVPDVLPSDVFGSTPHAVWADVAVLLPWTLYRRFGDLEVLRTQYPGMRAWVETAARLTEEGGGLWRQDVQLGDWLDPAAPPEDPGAARTDGDLVANAYVARSADVLARTARLLGEKDDAVRYEEFARAVRAAFADEFVTPGGRMSSDAQTAYALALCFALLPTERQRRGAAERLVHIVRTSGYRIATGFAGTPLICDALCAGGEPQSAYRMLLETGCPSWLYPVTMGATTVWERWDSMLPDGSINTGEMTSFNHYALGAVADWLHRTVAGLEAAEPGWRRLRIAPVPGGDLTFAKAAHDTPYGRAEAGWRIEGDTLMVEVLVPPGTRAEVQLPGDGEPFEVGSGRRTFRRPYTAPAWPPAAIRHPFAGPQ
ncbi:glycoside hydrolase family 78 protein [Streptomyces sp. NBC_00078]|uniref:glycoside hydrolase family 78 protein n=1 Tax=unclassified Streptomyces TaxID=2593676 RepID=UPI002259DAA4|nr:glycoside hydrolase family 78 protein [Streptomyces sp. NBC_00078]MCX5425586.1 glycoside hydrolase family 78 protein [Streptomyces sp. NBC_00078]